MIEVSIVVVGAGVAGLTTALLLSKQKRFSVTIVAKHMPGDYDIEYTSPWAGANYAPVSAPDTPEMQWDRDTFLELWRLANEVPGAGIHALNLTKYFRNKDIETAKAIWGEVISTDLWWKDLLPDFKVIPRDQLPPGADSGISATSLCINTALYLPWLVSQCLANGVVIKRHILTSLCEASSLHHSGSPAQLVVNCTGLSAYTLGGLGPDGKGDKLMYPARGQIVLVRNEMDRMVEISGTDDAEDEATYVMTRAAGGGTVLGGCYQKGNWESQPDPNMAMRIMRRAVELYPELGNGKGIAGLDVVRHSVGLRPVREGGTRLAASWVEGVLVVHNYGHGGFGYQSGYGCSMAAVKIVEDVLEDSSRVPNEEMVDFGKANL